RRKRRLLRVDRDGHLPDPVLSTLSVNRNLGCVSEAFQASLQTFLDSSPPSLQKPPRPEIFEVTAQSAPLA
ncbi:unnamed protein product, partial [Ascophyllum nodosum]